MPTGVHELQETRIRHQLFEDLKTIGGSDLEQSSKIDNMSDLLNSIKEKVSKNDMFNVILI